MIPSPRYFMLRLTRLGPLVPARLQWLDHEPGAPDNKLDRGRLSVFPAADVAGEETDPQVLFDRLYAPTDAHPAIAETHWKFAQTITETEYRYQLQRLRWAETHQRDAPALRPRAKIDPLTLPLPNFDRENAR